MLLAFAGCGGPSADPEEVLDRAFSQSIGTAQMSMSLAVALEGIPEAAEEPLRINLDGPYRSGSETALPGFDLTVGLDSGGLPAPTDALGLISTGDNLYLDVGGSAYEIGKDVVAEELKARAAESEGTANPFGVDPRSWVSEPKIEGEETIDGVETIHVTGALSVANMVQNLNEAAQQAAASGDTEAPVLTEQQMTEIESVVQDPTFDLYAGAEDGKIRRLSASGAFEVPEGDGAALGGLTGGRVTFELTFSGVGEPVEIEAPEDAAPIEELGTQIQALTGGLGGGELPSLPGGGGEDSGAGQESTPAPAPPQTNGDTGSFQEYTECVAQADPNDAAALEACTEIITGG